ncbi:GNAT family N-acetyltransferase [Methanococcoides sp. SA1]|nr:GNAT family N-acetyltransferase [Methanococcoides sp. SA1]
MSDIEVREINKNEYKIWDELVKSSPHGTIFHSADWLTLCSESFNKKLKIQGCFNKNEELIGGCSYFVYKRKGIFKIASSTSNLTPYGGFVLAPSSNTKVRRQMQEQHNTVNCLCSTLYDEHFDSIQMVNSPTFLDIRPFTWDKWNSSVHYAYYIGLEKDVKTNISKSVKGTVRKALKNGIQVKILKDFSIFYDLYSMTYARQNLEPPVSKEFMKKVFDLMDSKDIGKMWVAETSSGEAVAAEVVLGDNDQIFAWAAGSNPDYMKVGANSLLLYEELLDLKDMGFKDLNVMSANIPRLASFMNSFNPKLVPYYQVNFNSALYQVLETCHNIIPLKF